MLKSRLPESVEVRSMGIDSVIVTFPSQESLSHELSYNMKFWNDIFMEYHP